MNMNTEQSAEPFTKLFFIPVLKQKTNQTFQSMKLCLFIIVG